MRQKIFQQAVTHHFPKAKDAKDTSVKYLGMLQNGHEIDISKVLMATSLCSDDINVPSTTFFSTLFGPFIMGGLGGLPFAGYTGMVAFSHHIPDNGSGFIFYGPHIGITDKGVLGKMFRPRQEEPTSSCGALMGALSHFKQKDFVPSITAEDYQQGTLETLLFEFREEILADENPAKKITELTYDLIDKQVHEYLQKAKKEFKVQKVALLGGIIINTEHGMDDYFDVRNFEVLNIQRA